MTVSESKELFADYLNLEIIDKISSSEPNWFKERRVNALNNYNSLDIDQDQLFYKYTNLKDIDFDSLKPYWELEDNQKEDFNPLELQTSVSESPWGHETHLTKKQKEQGIFFGPLSQLIEQDEALAKKIVESSKFSDKFDKMGELAKAFSKSPVILYIPKGVKVKDILFRKIHLGNSAVLSFNETIVYAEEGSQVSLLDYYSGNKTNLNQVFVTSQSIYLQDNARLNNLAIQNWGMNVAHLGAKLSQVGPYGILKSLQHFQGGRSSRLNSGMKLSGRGSEGYDLFNSLGSGPQRFNFKSELIHEAEDTIGQTHSRTVMMNNAESVLRGLIHIPKSGRNANSYLSSNGLTIGSGKVIAVPALQIDQNEVVAGHAASVEPLSEEKLFYLGSRGINRTSAKSLLVKGYFEKVIQLLDYQELMEITRGVIVKKWEEINQ